MADANGRVSQLWMHSRRFSGITILTCSCEPNHDDIQGNISPELSPLISMIVLCLSKNKFSGKLTNAAAK